MNYFNRGDYNNDIKNSHYNFFVPSIFLSRYKYHIMRCDTAYEEMHLMDYTKKKSLPDNLPIF